MYRKQDRKKIPRELKIVRGTFRADREVKNPAALKTAIPEMPAHFIGDAKAEWERITGQLFAAGLVSDVDRASLAVYCDTWATWKALSEQLQTLKGQLSYSQNSALFSLQKKAAELMYRYLTEFGMTPASRSKIEAKPSKAAAPASRWEEFGT